MCIASTRHLKMIPAASTSQVAAGARIPACPLPQESFSMEERANTPEISTQQSLALSATKAKINSMASPKAQASKSPATLTPAALGAEASCNDRHSSGSGSERSRSTTDVVLEYFTPATRSTTESEFCTHGEKAGDCSSAPACNQHRAGSALDGRLYCIPSTLLSAEEDYTQKMALQRRRVISTSSQQPQTEPQQHYKELQQRHRQPQSQQQQQFQTSTSQNRLVFAAAAGGHSTCCAEVQRVSLEEAEALIFSAHGRNFQSHVFYKRQDLAAPMRATQPVKNRVRQVNSSLLRSWHYSAHPLETVEAPSVNGFVLKRRGVGDDCQNQRALQHGHRGYAEVATPAAAAEAALLLAPAGALTPWQGGAALFQSVPKVATLTRALGGVVQPATAAKDTKEFFRKAIGEAERWRSACRLTARCAEWSRAMLYFTPPMPQSADFIPRKEPVAAEQYVKGGDCNSALPFWYRTSDSPTISGNNQDDTAFRQRGSLSPRNVQQTSHQYQRTAATRSYPTASPPFTMSKANGQYWKPEVASGLAATNSAASPYDAQTSVCRDTAPAAGVSLLFPPQCAPTVNRKDAKQTLQQKKSRDPLESGTCSKIQDWKEETHSLNEPTSTRAPPTRPAPRDCSEFPNFDRVDPASGQTVAPTFWHNFFWKGTRHASSSRGSKSSSTQCSTPRGPTAASSSAPPDPASKVLFPSASPLNFLPKKGRRGPHISAGLPFSSWRLRHSSTNVAAERLQQQLAQQHPMWCFNYVSRNTTRPAQRIYTQVRQQQSVELAKDKWEQQQRQTSGSRQSYTETVCRSPLEALAQTTLTAPSWLCFYEATRLEVIGVPRGGGATRLLKSAEILLCKNAAGGASSAFGARVKEDRSSRQLIFVLPSREVVPVNRVKLLSCISQGSFGTVFRARWEGMTVAVKQAHGCMTLEAMRSVVREVNSFRSLNHPLILKYLGVCLDPNFLGIITEYLPGKSLFEALWDSKIVLTGDKRLRLCRQLVEAVNYMHTEKRLVHRDLKTSNLILDGDDGLKLCDFGKTRPLTFHGRLRLEDNGGSPRYMAPECFVVGNFIDEKVDIWGLGCCLMEIMGGPIPFENIYSNEGVIQAVTHKQMSPTVPTWFHPFVKTLLQGCFAFDPKKRPSAQQILDVLYMLSSEDVNRYGMNARRSA